MSHLGRPPRGARAQLCVCQGRLTNNINNNIIIRTITDSVFKHNKQYN